jgi:murein DD-endopeptidase MepM/ murein hydrolase activator NlpD
MRRRLLAGLVALVAASLLLPAGTAAAAIESQEVVYRRMTFPVLGGTSYSNTWMACRDSCTRNHEGTDIFGQKMQVLVAAADGKVAWTKTDGNNQLTITDRKGWRFVYVHINNDTPGTDDGANLPEFMFFPGVDVGTRVTAGQPIAYLGDSGNAETTAPHLHFEIRRPDGVVVNSYWSLMLAQGRRVNDRCAFDTNPEREPSMDAGDGYWTLTSDGGVYSFGDAPFFGSVSGMRLNAAVISLAPTATRRGYWELAGDGGIFSFGDARFFGSTGGMKLNEPIIGMAPTSTGEGYLLFASDGGVFTFGDATFLGSLGGRAPAPVVDVAPTPAGDGYWLLTSTGGIFPFGDAAFHGSVDWVGFCELPRSVKLAPTSTGGGYWIQTADGNTFAFGDASDLGSIKRSGLPTKPAVAVAPA